MANHSSLILTVMFGFVAALIPHQAEAALPDQPCSEAGKTTLSDDQHNMLACLFDESHTLLWTKLAAQGRSAPPPIPASPNAPSASHANWQGWYAGVNAGLADTNSSFDQVTLGYTTYYNTNLHSLGGTAGLVGGYNWVRNDGLFYGGEVDVNYMSNSEQASAAPARSVWNGYSTVRGRVGMAFDPALVFLTGGLALVDVDNERHSARDGFNYTDDDIHVGWTAGAGAEFLLTNRMSMNIQYLFVETPENTQTYRDSFGNLNKDLLDNSDNILRVGLNWHFN